VSPSEGLKACRLHRQQPECTAQMCLRYESVCASARCRLSGLSHVEVLGLTQQRNVERKRAVSGVPRARPCQEQRVAVQLSSDQVGGLPCLVVRHCSRTATVVEHALDGCRCTSEPTALYMRLLSGLLAGPIGQEPIVCISALDVWEHLPASCMVRAEHTAQYDQLHSVSCLLCARRSAECSKCLLCLRP